MPLRSTPPPFSSLPILRSVSAARVSPTSRQEISLEFSRPRFSTERFPHSATDYRLFREFTDFYRSFEFRFRIRGTFFLLFFPRFDYTHFPSAVFSIRGAFFFLLASIYIHFISNRTFSFETSITFNTVPFPRVAKKNGRIGFKETIRMVIFIQRAMDTKLFIRFRADKIIEIIFFDAYCFEEDGIFIVTKIDETSCTFDRSFL